MHRLHAFKIGNDVHVYPKRVSTESQSWNVCFAIQFIDLHAGSRLIIHHYIYHCFWNHSQSTNSALFNQSIYINWIDPINLSAFEPHWLSVQCSVFSFLHNMVCSCHRFNENERIGQHNSIWISINVSLFHERIATFCMLNSTANSSFHTLYLTLFTLIKFS